MAVPPPSRPSKNELRTLLRGRRRAFVSALGPTLRQALLEALADRVLADVRDDHPVSGYVAIGAEIDPAPLLARLAARGVALALPHVGETAGGETAGGETAGAMRFLRWRPGEPLVAGPRGLLQPSAAATEIEPRLILTPLVGFDRARRRLGQGGGYYDRAFAAHPAARRVGLAWSVQEAEGVPMDPWDMLLDAVATEREWIA